MNENWEKKLFIHQICDDSDSVRKITRPQTAQKLTINSRTTHASFALYNLLRNSRHTQFCS